MKTLIALFALIAFAACMTEPDRPSSVTVDLGYFSTYRITPDTLFMRGIDLDLSKTPYQVKSINQKRLMIVDYNHKSWFPQTEGLRAGQQQLFKRDSCFFTFESDQQGVICLDGLIYYLEI